MKILPLIAFIFITTFASAQMDTAKLKAMCAKARNGQKGIAIMCVDSNYNPIPSTIVSLYKAGTMQYMQPTDNNGFCIFGKRYSPDKTTARMQARFFCNSFHYSDPLGECYIFKTYSPPPQRTAITMSSSTPSFDTVRQQKDTVPQSLHKSGVRIVPHQQ